MKKVIDELEEIILKAGLSRKDIVEYWQQETDYLTSIGNVLNPDFSERDIRSRINLFWYAFAGGKFAPDPKAYPNCQGVVGWINPDPNAPVGDRIYVVLPDQIETKYSDGGDLARVFDVFDGRANTKQLLNYGKEENVEFPAAEYAFNYCKNGVKKGEAFLPAREQLRRVIKNKVGVRLALKAINGTFLGWLISSSEYDYYLFWGVDSDSEELGGSKSTYGMVSCFLAY